LGELHALVAAHTKDPTQVVVGIETDRGLLVGALLAAGYQVYAVNPHTMSRYRGHGSSRTKSDRGDAKVLADLVRTDRHNHRPVAGDTPAVEAVKVLAHQSLVWARQRHVNALRSALREFYPGAAAALGAQLAEPEALAVLALAPTPKQGRRLARMAVRRALVGAGRRRNLQARVVAVHVRWRGARRGAGRAGAGRVRRRPAPLWRRQGPQVARRHRPGHPVLGAAHRGGRPGGVQAAAGGRLLSVGVRGPDRLARRTALL
jgi:transposase